MNNPISRDAPLPIPDLTAPALRPIPDLTAPAPRPTAAPALPIADLVLAPPTFNPPPILLPILGVAFFVSFLLSIGVFFSITGLLLFFGVSLSFDLGLKTILGLSLSLDLFSLYSLRAESVATDSGSISPNRSLYLSSRLFPFESII